MVRTQSLRVSRKVIKRASSIRRLVVFQGKAKIASVFLMWHVCVFIPERGRSAIHKRAISPAWPSTPGLNVTAKRTFLANLTVFKQWGIYTMGKEICHKDFNYRPVYMGVLLCGEGWRGFLGLWTNVLNKWLDVCICFLYTHIYGTEGEAEMITFDWSSISALRWSLCLIWTLR